MCNINNYFNENDNVNATVQIRGKLAFNELRKKSSANARTGKPYALTLDDACLIESNVLRTEIGDDLYGKVISYFTDVIDETRRDDGSSVFFARSYSNFSPEIFYIDGNGEKKMFDDESPLPRNLANGLDVTVGIDIFVRNKNGSVSTGIKYVICNEQIRFFKPTAETLWPVY